MKNSTTYNNPNSKILTKVLSGEYNWVLADETPLISDTHFFHTNIQRYCNRPENWQATIIANWNQLVEKKQKILHLGDVMLGSRTKENYLLDTLKGEIHVIQGNHDSFLCNGWHTIEGDLSLETPEYYLLISHYPRKMVQINGQKPIFNLHGHIHNNPTPEFEDLYHLNLSVEVRNYSPVLMKDLRQEILQRIAKLPVKNPITIQQLDSGK